jgi:hypothetical protein
MRLGFTSKENGLLKAQGLAVLGKRATGTREFVWRGEGQWTRKVQGGFLRSENP